MNDRRDDLASAWLDGELSDADVSSWPDRRELEQARDELGRVRDALARRVPSPAGLADRQIAAALDALGSDASGAATVVPLHPGGTRRSGRAAGRVRSAPLWLSRAAVALVLLGAGGAAAVALSRTGTGDEDRAATLSAPAPGVGTANGASQEANSRLEAPEAEQSPAGPGSGGARSTSPADASALAGAAASTTLSQTATALLAEGEVAPDELRRQLEDRFGPPSAWRADETSRGHCVDVPTDDPSGGLVAAVPLERDGVPFELVVPAAGPAYLADPVTCRRVP